MDESVAGRVVAVKSGARTVNATVTLGPGGVMPALLKIDTRRRLFDVMARLERDIRAKTKTRVMDRRGRAMT